MTEASTYIVATGNRVDARETEFRAFVEIHRERAVRLAWRLLGGDRAGAEDVAQDAFLKAYDALPGYRADASLTTWFYRILTRQAYNHRRWRKVRELWSGLWTGDEADPTPAAAGDPGLQKRLAAALENLSQSQREVFVLVHLEGFSVQETADLLEKSPGTVKSHLHRALESLRVQLCDLRAGEADLEEPPSGG